jgi:hypothetical protein
MAGNDSELAAYRLFQSVMLQALRDLRSSDTITSLDALLWLIDDETCLWSEATEINIDPGLILQAIAEGRLSHARQTKPVDFAGGRDKRYEQNSID